MDKAGGELIKFKALPSRLKSRWVFPSETDETPLDLRHTFASRLVMKGVYLRTVQELMGHKTITMTLRYSHLSPAHQLEAVQGLNRPATGTSTKAPKAPGLPELFLGN